MEKMDLIQTCLNNRLLEANISCFTYAWLFCKPAACEPLHKRVPTSGAVGFCGCTSLEMLSPEEQSPLVETQGHNPAGGGSTWWPQKEPTPDQCWRKPSNSKRTIGRKQPEFSFKAFTKPAKIPVFLATRVVVLCITSSILKQRRAHTEMRNETTERQLGHQAARKANTQQQKNKLLKLVWNKLII